MQFVKKVSFGLCVVLVLSFSGCKNSGVKEFFIQNTQFVVDGVAFDKMYKSRDINGNMFVEVVRDFEKLEDWSKLVTVRYQPIPVLQNDLVNYAKKFAQIYLILGKKHDPKSIGSVAMNEESSEAIADLFAASPKKGYMEYSVIRYVPNRYNNGLISLQFSKRIKSDKYYSKSEISLLRKSWMEQIVKIDMKEAGSYVGQL